MRYRRRPYLAPAVPPRPVTVPPRSRRGLAGDPGGRPSTRARYEASSGDLGAFVQGASDAHGVNTEVAVGAMEAIADRRAVRKRASPFATSVARALARSLRPSALPLGSLRSLPFLAAFVWLVAAGGCALDRHQGDLTALVDQGQYQAAAALLDEDGVRNSYGVRSRTLYLLERGAVAVAMNDRDTAFEMLDRAEARIADQRRTALDNIGRWTINDRTAPYQAAPHEDMYVNVLKMLNHLEAGVLHNGASVEARRYIEKTEFLRIWSDEFAREGRRSLPEEGVRSQLRQEAPDEFIESPLGTFVAAIVFMREGSTEYQRVASRRLQQTIDYHGPLVGPVNPEHFLGLDELRPGPGQLLAIGLSGRGPTKHAERIPPLLIGGVPIYFEIPVLAGYRSEVAGAEVEFDTGEVAPLDLVELTGQVAQENYKRLLPGIYTRAFLRAAAKATGSAVLTHAMDDDGARLLAALAGLTFLVATERADLRTWITLPARADGAIVQIPDGATQARVVYRGPGGGTLYSGPWRPVAPGDRELTTIVTHYWR
jgi:uncharacterized protein